MPPAAAAPSRAGHPGPLGALHSSVLHHAADGRGVPDVASPVTPEAQALSRASRTDGHLRADGVIKKAGNTYAKELDDGETISIDLLVPSERPQSDLRPATVPGVGQLDSLSARSLIKQHIAKSSTSRWRQSRSRAAVRSRRAHQPFRGLHGCYRACVDLFTLSWTALRTAATGLPDAALARPSGCRGWLVRDLLCHLVIDAQDVLITLATPAETAPTADALSYWTPRAAPPDGSDPLDPLTARLAAAYEDPALLRDHLEDVGAAAGRAALLAHPDLPVSTRGMTLAVRDYLGAYVLEWTLHHLDLVAHLGEGGDLPTEPSSADGLPADGQRTDGLPADGQRTDGLPADGPPAETLASARDMVERRLRLRLPPAWSDADALRVATGRRPAGAVEQEELDSLGPRGQMLPLSFGRPAPAASRRPPSRPS